MLPPGVEEVLGHEPTAGRDSVLNGGRAGAVVAARLVLGGLGSTTPWLVVLANLRGRLSGKSWTSGSGEGWPGTSM